MAPNTVKLHQLTSAFATIDKDAIFNRKTTPLLNDVEAQQSQQQQQEEQNIFSADYMIAKQLKDNAEAETNTSSATSSSSDDDYWGWSNDETSTQRQAKETKKLIAKILEEEEIRVMLSSEALERREVEAASASNASPVCEYEEGESDFGCWAWPANTHDNKYEFSVERIEERLSEEVPVAQNEQISTPAALPKSNVSEGGYWDWAYDESCSAEERKEKELKALITKLLEEEEIRMSFMATEISARLVQESEARSSIGEEVKEEQEIVAAENGGYWDW